MARIARLLLHGESATYHIVSRTALQGFVLDDVQKDLFVRLSCAGSPPSTSWSSSVSRSWATTSTC